MGATAERQKQSDENGAKARAEPGVVVSSAPPLGEAILQEVVITLTARAAENVGNNIEALGSFVGLLFSGRNFTLRGPTVDVYALLSSFGSLLVFGGVGNERAPDFVRMEEFRCFTVGFIQIILVGVGLGTYEVCTFELESPFDSRKFARPGFWEYHCTVECHIHPFCSSNFIMKSENLVV